MIFEDKMRDGKIVFYLQYKSSKAAEALGVVRYQVIQDQAIVLYQMHAPAHTALKIPFPFRPMMSHARRRFTGRRANKYLILFENTTRSVTYTCRGVGSLAVYRSY